MSAALAARMARRWSAISPELARTSPQLSGLRREAPDAVAEVLANVLVFTAAQFNVSKNLTNLQIATLVPDLLKRYYYWRLDEFIYVCREGVAGRWAGYDKHARVFDRLESALILFWCQLYDENERDEAIRIKGEQEHRVNLLLNGDGRIDDMPRALARKALESQDDDELMKRLAYCESQGDELTAGLVQEVLDARAAAARREGDRLDQLREKARGVLAEHVASETPLPELQAKADEFFEAARPAKLPGVHSMKVVRDNESAA